MLRLACLERSWSLVWGTAGAFTVCVDMCVMLQRREVLDTNRHTYL